MEENRIPDYKQEYDHDPMESPNADKSIRGYRLVIGILAFILVAISVLYLKVHADQKRDYEYLVIEKDSIQQNLGALMEDFDNLQVANDTISQNLTIERNKADSLMERLKNERSLNLRKIKQYEKEVGLLRSIMKGYIKQIDSLNTLNKQLITENVDYRKQVATQIQRAEMAEEKAAELDTKIRQGSVIRARDITLTTLNASGKPVTRAARAARLRVDLVLSGNDLANPGERTVYARITSPDGYLLTNDAAATFDFEGSPLIYTASREIDYQNDDLDVGLFYNGDGIVSGKYSVQIYMDGYLIGSTEMILK